MRFAITLLAVASALSAADSPAGRARVLYNRTEYAAAIATLSGEQKDPANLLLLGQSYFMQADFKRAVEALEKAAALDPRSSEIQNCLGRAYGRRAETASPFSSYGYAKKTRLAFERALQLDPRNGDAAGDLFDFFMQAPALVGGGIDKARSLLPAISSIDPSQAQVDQARLDEARKEYGSAEAKLKRAIDLAPYELGRVLELAQFYAREGRHEESEQAFNKAQQLAPGSARILYARAEALIESKRDPAEARELLHRYLAARLTPNDPPRSEALKLLRKAEGD